MEHLQRSKSEHDEHEAIAHPVSVQLLVGVLVTLLFLTWLTVAASNFGFGPWSVYIALAIAFCKASLVGLYFMHLRWDRPFNAFLLVSCLAFIALFLGICMIDTREYHPRVDRVPGKVQEALDAAAGSLDDGDAGH